MAIALQYMSKNMTFLVRGIIACIKMTSFVQFHYISKDMRQFCEKNIQVCTSKKGTQHFFKRNAGLFSRKATAVKSSLEEVKKFMEGGQNYNTKEPFK